MNNNKNTTPYKVSAELISDVKELFTHSYKMNNLFDYDGNYKLFKSSKFFDKHPELDVPTFEVMQGKAVMNFDGVITAILTKIVDTVCEDYDDPSVLNAMHRLYFSKYEGEIGRLNRKFSEKYIMLDPKRPFGNSHIAGDLYEIINGHPEDWDEVDESELGNCLDMFEPLLDRVFELVLNTEIEPFEFTMINNYPYQVNII